MAAGPTIILFFLQAASDTTNLFAKQSANDTTLFGNDMKADTVTAAALLAAPSVPHIPHYFWTHRHQGGWRGGAHLTALVY